MSEFDKEEERRKLREKFERDEQRRQTTQQMSELLLKGATMLNVHCADCASPIFRHEGEEFCPSCGRSVDELQTAEAEMAAEEGSAAEEQPAEIPETGEVQRQPPEPAEAEPADEPVREPEPLRVGTPQTNAGAALQAVIARLADQAAAADDPRRAKEYLEAAHLAAETFALLEGGESDR